MDKIDIIFFVIYFSELGIYRLSERLNKEVKMTNLIGKQLDEFKVNAFQAGKDFFQVTNEDLKGHWSVLFFYPGDFTFVCPTELEALAEEYENFKKAGCEVYSVSTDSEFVHMEWQKTSPAVSKAKYVMLADRAFELSRMLGVLNEEEGQAYRGSFVINPDGIITAYEIHDMGIGRSPKELLRKVEASKFVNEHGDKVCPANWMPGEDTLTPGMDLVGTI